MGQIYLITETDCLLFDVVHSYVTAAITSRLFVVVLAYSSLLVWHLSTKTLPGIIISTFGMSGNPVNTFFI